MQQTQTSRAPGALRWTLASVAAAALVAALALVVAPGGHGEAEAVAESASGATTLRPTAHPPIPTTTADAWFVPDEPRPLTPPAYKAFVAAVEAARAADHAKVIAALERAALERTPLEHWASYYRAVALTGLGRLDEARVAFSALRERQPAGFVDEASLVQTAEVASALGDFAAAVSAYEALTHRRTASPDLVLDRLARTAQAAGDSETSRAALSRLYFDHPLSALGAAVEPQVAEWRRSADPAFVRQLFELELARAERLFAARRWADARSAFERLRDRAEGDERELADLRIAACDYRQRRHKAAVDRLQPWLDTASRRAEARYYYLSALRPLGRHAEYVALARALVEEFPDSPWAAEALDGLGTHYILTDDDAAAVDVFRTLFERFPESRHAERAGWKLGWSLYKSGEYRDAARVFERAAAMAPRSDYRPPWLYWAGRAYDRLGETARANDRYALVTVDYLNSYYGRLAARWLAARGVEAGRLEAPIALETAAPVPPRVPPPLRTSVETPPPPTRDVIETLLALDLYDLALDELAYAQRVWGTSSAIEATLAWVYARQGDLRRGINTMRRAYPQFMAAGGEQLPEPILQTIFPVDHWDLIQKYARQHGLDPYLVVALVAQESTFQPAVRSSANAYGLMQIIPATGRRLARQEGLRFSTRLLTNPQANVRLGTRHFAALIKQFGGAHFALASYNAGEHRVLRWQRERPGLDDDEFIDDIPFPETQNYVKRILGTAEDYRRLYGGAEATAPPPRLADDDSR